MGFIGAHSDIGGGYAEGDLSDVALSWMYQQAKFAGVSLKALPSEYTSVKNPIWHDSNTKAIGSGFDDSGDRKFRYQGGASYDQKGAPVAGMNYSNSLSYLQPYPTAKADAHGDKVLRGTIDMKGYAAWLKTNYGLDMAY